jgi:hypothetical protein
LPATILHDNGRTRAFVDSRRLVPNLGPVYCRILAKEVLADRGLRGQSVKPRNLDVVLCSTKPSKQYTERGLDALGIDGYVVLGRNLSDWKHVDKIQLVLDHVNRHPGPELLLHLDAPDVLVVGNLQTAADVFLNEFSCDLLLGAEKGSAPGSNTTIGITTVERRFIERIEDFERGTYRPPACHLNAGCFIGRKDAIRELFTKVLEGRETWPISSELSNGNLLADDDQLILRELHRTHHPRVQIDHQNAVFQNLFAIKRSELAVDRRVAHGPVFFVELLKHLVFLVGRRVRRNERLGA